VQKGTFFDAQHASEEARRLLNAITAGGTSEPGIPGSNSFEK